MKNYSLLIITCTLFSTYIKAQDNFAPVGTKWKYKWYMTSSYGKPNPTLDTNATNTIVAIKDTVIASKNCRKIQIEHPGSEGCYYDFQYIYSDSGKVYYYYDLYNYANPFWALLFDINKNVGESFQIQGPSSTGVLTSNTATVTMVSYININGKNLKSLNLSNGDRVIENIGSTSYLCHFWSLIVKKGIPVPV